jgi:uncharacterized protein (TIGR02300 family)
MTKPGLGTKRPCAKCGAKFYDVLHSPPTCPKCDTVLAIADVSSSQSAPRHRADRSASPNEPSL